MIGLRCLLLTPNLLRLTIDLLGGRLLINTFLPPGLARGHSILLLSKNLLRRRLPVNLLRGLLSENLLGLWLLSLLPTAATAMIAAFTTTATTASRRGSALLLLLSRRPAVRVAATAAVTSALGKNVLIQA
jgi:hypothetical protein